MITDAADHQLAPEAWTTARNIRFEDGKAKRASGYSQAMGPPTVAPGFVFGIDNGGDTFWIYASAIGSGSKVYVFNNSTHTDISKAGNYAVTNYRQWNGTMLHGIPILNHGNGAPQYWAAFNPLTDLADITAWPASTTAKVVRSYKNYLIALNMADGSGNYYHRVRWSDGAAVGTLPASWTAGATSDAGSYDLTDVSSQIIDGETLGDVFVIYKGESTWLLRYIGGQFIMAREQKLQASGILAPRCVAPLTLPINSKQVHFVKSSQDLGVFDAQVFESILTKRVRKYLNASIDASGFENSFVFDHPTKDEAYFCYPENGATDPNVALVWNYRENTLAFRDWVGVAASQGVLEVSINATWNAYDVVWDSVGELGWQEASRRKVVVADQVSTHFYELEAGDTADGASFTSTLQRTGLAVIGQDRSGDPIVDYNARKTVSRVWPKVTGAAVGVRLGGAEVAGGTITWGAADTFDPGAGVPYIDLFTTSGDPLNTRFIAIEFSTTGDSPWTLEGYGLEVDVVGNL